MSAEHINQTPTPTPTATATATAANNSMENNTIENRSNSPKQVEYDVEGPLTLDETKFVDDIPEEVVPPSPSRLIVGEEEMKKIVVEEHKHVEFDLPDDISNKDTRMSSIIGKRDSIARDNEDENATKKLKTDSDDDIVVDVSEEQEEDEEENDQKTKKKESVLKKIKHKISHVFSKDDQHIESSEEATAEEIVEDSSANTTETTEENDEPAKKRRSTVKKIKSRISGLFSDDKTSEEDSSEVVPEEVTEETSTKKEDAVDEKIVASTSVEEDMTTENKRSSTVKKIKSKISGIFHIGSEEVVVITEPIAKTVTEEVVAEPIAAIAEAVTEEVPEEVVTEVVAEEQQPEKKRTSKIKSFKNRISGIFKSDDKDKVEEAAEKSSESLADNNNPTTDEVKEESENEKEESDEEKKISVIKNFKKRVSSIISINKEDGGSSIASKESVASKNDESPEEAKDNSNLTLEGQEVIKKEGTMKKLQHQITDIFTKHKETEHVEVAPVAIPEVETEEVTEEAEEAVAEATPQAVAEATPEINEEAVEETTEVTEKKTSMIKKIKKKINSLITPKKNEVLTEESLNEILNGSSDEVIATTTISDTVASATSVASVKSNSSTKSKEHKTGIFGSLMDKIKGKKEDSSNEAALVKEEIVEEDETEKVVTSEEQPIKEIVEEASEEEHKEENKASEKEIAKEEDIPVVAPTPSRETVKGGMLCWTYQKDAIPSSQAEVLRWGMINKRTELRRSYKVSYGRIMSDGVWQWSKNDKFTSPHGLYLKSNMTLKIIKKKESSNKTPYILKVIIPWGKKDDGEKTIVNLAFRTVEDRQPWINTFLQIKQKLIKEEV